MNPSMRLAPKGANRFFFLHIMAINMKANVSVWPFLLLTAVFAAFTIACSKDPEVAKREYVRSGDAYVAKKQYKEAVIEYRNAVQLDPKYGEARAKLADAYFRA